MDWGLTGSHIRAPGRWSVGVGLGNRKWVASTDRGKGTAEPTERLPDGELSGFPLLDVLCG